MPWTPSIRYYNSRNAYYTKFRGKQHLLAAGPKDEPDGPTYKAAVLRFSQIMHADETGRAEDNCIMSAIVSRYYFFLNREGRDGTLRLARSMLDPSIVEFGHVKVKELKPVHVDDWINKMGQWNSSTRHTAIGCLSRALYWAKEQGIITANPIADMKKPEKLVRGKEVSIPEPLAQLMIQTANREFSKFLQVLHDTGARPGEIMNAECKHYRRSIGAIVLPWNAPAGEYRWKCAKKTKRDRVIYLTPELQELVEAEIAARKGIGPIFQTVRKKRWGAKNLVSRLDILLKKYEVIRKWCRENRFNPAKVMCYSFRHGYITRMLLAGCPIKILADLCGTSVAMIEKNYSHAHDDLDAMRGLFLQFSSAASVQPLP